MIKKKDFFLKKNIFLFFCLIFLIIINFVFSKNSSIYGVKKKNDLLCQYKIDPNSKHDFLGWKHDLGSCFSKKVHLFYSIENIKTIPCNSFKEWLNLKQLLFALLNYHIPKMDLMFDMINFLNFKEEFIDDKYDRLAVDTAHFCYLLKKNPSLGCFYLNPEDLNYIESFNISFCNCHVSGHSILELISEIISLKDKDMDIFLKHLFDYLNYLNKKFNTNFENKNKNLKKIHMSIEQLLDKISSNSDIDSLDKNLLFHLIKNFISYCIPNIFLVNFSVDQNDIHKKPLKECKSKLYFESNHKTVGFLFKIKSQKEKKIYVYFYEIFKNEVDDIEKLRLIDKILVSSIDSIKSSFLNHLLISVTKNKKYLNKKISLFRAKN
ncbi:hypothetical protein [Candidatus Phytoplasma sacchari]|uniref:Uncharacterized protein n=1 Tax=Candidatus Phytoplasma sacchari TaxID=2609813 RepID=A0ABY7M139_9MOLU|nr:hypothetical protein O7R10_02485 [Candidatus Phytoplasma sacchari]